MSAGLVADAIRGALHSDNAAYRKTVNVTDGLFEIAHALDRLANAIGRLGNADAATPMGAIEAFGAHIGEKLDALTGAIESLSGDPR